MPKITEMYCFATYDKDEDDEGVIAYDTPLGCMPMVGADMLKVDQLKPFAQDVANHFRKPVRIYKFSQKDQIGEIIPEIP